VEFINSNLTETSCFELGLTQVVSLSAALTRAKNIFLLNSNNINLNKYKGKNIIFIGSNGSSNLSHATFILPCLSYLEKVASFITNAGIVRRTNNMVKVLREVRSDIHILNVLSVLINKRSIFGASESLAEMIISELPLNPRIFARRIVFNTFGKSNVPCSVIETNVKNFFLLSHFQKTSVVMRKCAKNILVHKNSYRIYKKLN